MIFVSLVHLVVWCEAIKALILLATVIGDLCLLYDSGLNRCSASSIVMSKKVATATYPSWLRYCGICWLFCLVSLRPSFLKYGLVVAWPMAHACVPYGWFCLCLWPSC